MAWAWTLETSSSVVFGNAMVGFLAEEVFGYDLEQASAAAHAGDGNVRALGNALMLVTFFPWVLCFVFFSLLHWSYPLDLKRLDKAGRVNHDEAPVATVATC
eukprot:CAMPEP_0198550202 /NCGR_PEP_ID=MMETSP1462-20131121/74270_1 /TAXON_ID=1333877 /ORGANISM="Brandtodinium nutriculum, Strain RCC3387" /LENGTH=101 /DNA_ID=CAMNT_0044280803 /DNA_START=41 /DNA_END=346 /DNA_ORIENTATION=+